MVSLISNLLQNVRFIKSETWFWTTMWHAW